MGVHLRMGLPGKRFNKNAKIRISRGSADLKFLLGNNAIRAPGRRARNGPFRISITYSNTFCVLQSAPESSVVAFYYRTLMILPILGGTGDPKMTKIAQP